MEGRAALKPQLRAQWSWVVPWVAAGITPVITSHVGAPRVVNVVVGLVAGIAWQLLHRRDLASRLTFMAACVTVLVVLTLVSRSSFEWDDMNTAGLFAIGVLLGLIYTEHVQRLHDRSAWRRSVPNAPATNAITES